MHVQKDKHNALAPHYEKCAFIGYPQGYKGWKFYNPTTKHTIISERADFDKRYFLASKKCPNPPSALPSLPADGTHPNPYVARLCWMTMNLLSSMLCRRQVLGGYINLRILHLLRLLPTQHVFLLLHLLLQHLHHHHHLFYQLFHIAPLELVLGCLLEPEIPLEIGES